VEGRKYSLRAKPLKTQTKNKKYLLAFEAFASIDFSRFLSRQKNKNSTLERFKVQTIVIKLNNIQSRVVQQK